MNGKVSSWTYITIHYMDHGNGQNPIFDLIFIKFTLVYRFALITPRKFFSYAFVAWNNNNNVALWIVNHTTARSTRTYVMYFIFNFSSMTRPIWRNEFTQKAIFSCEIEMQLTRNYINRYDLVLYFFLWFSARLYERQMTNLYWLVPIHICVNNMHNAWKKRTNNGKINKAKWKKKYFVQVNIF